MVTMKTHNGLLFRYDEYFVIIFFFLRDSIVNLKFEYADILSKKTAVNVLI